MNSEEMKSIQAYARYAFGLDMEAAEVKADTIEPGDYVRIVEDVTLFEDEFSDSADQDLIYTRDIQAVGVVRTGTLSPRALFPGCIAVMFPRGSFAMNPAHIYRVDVNALHEEMAEMIVEEAVELADNEATRLAIIGLNIFEAQRKTLEAALRDTELERDARGIILNHAIERAEAAGVHTGNGWYQAIDGMADTITALQSRVRELEAALRPFAQAAQDEDVQSALDVHMLEIHSQTFGRTRIMVNPPEETVEFLRVEHLRIAAAALPGAANGGSDPV